jgi:fructose-1,6-bisphosphatase/inositol monophosphatase family enzyme
MKKLFSANIKLNIFFNEIYDLGKKLESYQINKKYFKILKKTKFKTKVDLIMHVNLSKILKKFINCKIVSEETNLPKSIPDKFWLIDPLDGTRSFVNGFDGYVIQGCYIKYKKPTLSFVFAPRKNLFWHAEFGKGAFLNGKLLKKNNNLKYILVDNYPKPKGIAKTIFERLDMKKYIECGSIGLKCCLVASNMANLFVKDIKFYDWDIMPANLILKELNYFISDLKGNIIKLSNDLKKNNGLIVTNDKKYLKNILQLNLYEK